MTTQEFCEYCNLQTVETKKGLVILNEKKFKVHYEELVHRTIRPIYSSKLNTGNKVVLNNVVYYEV